MSDLVNSISTIARTFDPNGTNIELSRSLLSVALGEGLEMEDPGQVVEKVFPPGYKDPAMAALEAQQAAQQQGAPEGEGEESMSAPMSLAPPPPMPAPTGEADAAPVGSPPPEQAMEAATKGDYPSNGTKSGPAKRLSPEAQRKLALRKQQLGEDLSKAGKKLTEDE